MSLKIIGQQEKLDDVSVTNSIQNVLRGGSR